MHDKSTKHTPNYEIWKTNLENAISQDYDFSSQWNYIGIDTTTKSRKQFDNNSTSLFKNRKGKYKVKVHNSTERAQSPYEYACNFLNYSDTFQNFICDCFGLPKYDDVFNSYTETPIKAKVAKKPFKPLRKESKKDSQIVRFDVRRASEFDTNVIDYLTRKANISTLHLAENDIFQIEKASKTYDNGYTSVMESDLLFGVRLEGSECYKIIDKANKKLNWCPNLDYARKNGLLAKDYSYSLGIDTFISTQDFAYLAAGEMDFLALKENGLENVFTVGNETSSISEYVLKKLKNKGIKTIFVVYDTDFTGIRNSVKLHGTVQDGITFKRVELPQLKKQSFKYNKQTQKFDYAYSDTSYKTIPNNSETGKPIFNDICDYIGKYGFDEKIKEALTNYQEPITPPKPQYKYDYTLYIERFLGSALLEDKTVFDALTNENIKTVLIKGSTGIGKSTAILELARFFSGFLNKKILLVSPRVSIASQQAEENEKLLFVGGNAFEESTEKLLNDIDGNDILYCNNDNLERLIELLELKGIDFYPIIDEPHLLPSDATIQGRKRVIKSVLRVIDKYKTLLLTATPKKTHFKTFDINVVATKKKEYPKSKVYVAKGNKGIQQSVDLIVESVQSGRGALQLLNSINSIRKVQLALKKYNIDCYVFASKKLTPEEKEEYEKLKKGTFVFKKNAKKRVVLGTSCIATGVNFESEIDIDVIDFNQHKGFNFIENIQLKGRIRNYESINVYSHIITPSLNKIDEIDTFDFDKVVARAARHAYFFNCEYEAENEEYERSKIRLESSKLCTFNDTTQLFEVDYTQIYIDYEKHLIENYCVLSDNPISVEHIDKAATEETEQSCKAVNEEQAKVINYIAELYLNYFKILCKAVHTQTEDKDYLRPKTFKEIRYSEFEDEIRLSDLELDAAEQLLRRHFFLTEIASFQKVQASLIQQDEKTGELKFVVKANYAKVVENFRLDYLFSLPKTSIEERKEMKLVRARINRIISIATEKITLKELHEKFNKRVRHIEARITQQYLNILLDRFFDVKRHRNENKKTDRKTYLTISRKKE